MISVCLSGVLWPWRRPLRGILVLTSLHWRNKVSRYKKSLGFLGKWSCGEKMSPPVCSSLKAYDWCLNREAIRGCSEVVPWCCYHQELWAPPGQLHPLPRVLQQPWTLYRVLCVPESHLLVIFHFSLPHFKEQPTQLASKGINKCAWQSTSNQRICSLLSKAACQWFLSERLMVQVIHTVMDISNDQYRFVPFFHSWMCNNLCCQLGEVYISLVCFVKTASAWKKLMCYT